MAAHLTAERRAQMEADAWRLRVRGWSMTKIAAKLGVQTSTISRAMDRVERRVLAKLTRRVELTKARQTAQLEFIQEQALSAWQRSKRPAETTRTTADPPAKGSKAKPTPVEVVTTVKGQVGDPRYLAEARAALDDIRKLWGLNHPEPPADGSELRALLAKAAAYLDPDEAPATPTTDPPADDPEPAN